MKVDSWDKVELPPGHGSVFSTVGIVLVALAVVACIFAIVAFDASYPLVGWFIVAFASGGLTLGLACIFCGGIINEIRRSSLENAVREKDPRAKIG